MRTTKRCAKQITQQLEKESKDAKRKTTITVTEDGKEISTTDKTTIILETAIITATIMVTTIKTTFRETDNRISISTITEVPVPEGGVFHVMGQTIGGRTVPTPAQSPPAKEVPITTTENREKLSIDDLSLLDKYDFACDDISDNVSVKGSLKRNIAFWKSIDTNEFILDVIENGYRLPFISEPQSNHLKNNKSSLENDEFVKSAILELVKSGSVVETTDKPFVINPLTVAQNKKKKRLVLDLRYINPHLWKEKIKFEDWQIALNYYTENCFMFDFDLKSGYHHIDINEEFQKFLGFSWKFDGKERYFHFTVLPFGFSTAGHIFTKLIRCIVKS